MAHRYELDADERRNWRLAKLFDIRSFIGVLFIIFGVLVLIPGLTAGPAELQKAAGMNIALWVGALMLALGVVFMAWLLLSPPPPVTKAEMEEARKALEDMGTSGGLHH